jgi:hypothetical protein
LDFLWTIIKGKVLLTFSAPKNTFAALQLFWKTITFGIFLYDLLVVISSFAMGIQMNQIFQVIQLYAKSLVD